MVFTLWHTWCTVECAVKSTKPYNLCDFPELLRLVNFLFQKWEILNNIKKEKKNERKHKILLQNSPLKMAIQLPGLSETAKKKKKSMIAVYLQATKENQTRVSEKNLQKSLYSSLHKSYSFIKKINQSWRFIK